MTSSTHQKTRIAVLTASTVLFPVTFYYFSPVISLAGGSAGIITGSGVVFLAQLVAASVLGKAFCSWVCPMSPEVEEKRVRRVGE